MTKLASVQVRFEYVGRKTFCYITQTRSRKTIVETSVKRFIEDDPSKLLGRRNAFKKAMQIVAKNNLLARKTRTTIWKEFNKEVKQPAF